MKRLLIVADRFLIRGRGLLVVPEVDLGKQLQVTLEVDLRRPDGTTVRATALGQLAFGHRGHVLMFQLEKADVPIGTEVWM